MTTVRSVAQAIFSSWFGLITSIVLSFFLAPFIVNALGDVYYGIWAVMMQFTGYLYLMDFGLRDSIIKNVAKYKARKQDKQLSVTLSVALSLYAGMTLICLIITAALVLALDHIAEIPETHIAEASIVVMLTGATIAQTFLFNIFSGAMMGLQRYLTLNAISITLNIARAAAIVVALGSGQKIVGLALIHFLTGFLTGICYLFVAIAILRKSGLSLRLHWVPWANYRRVARNLFGFSIFVFINNIGQKIIYATDAVVIVAFLPVAFVTPYAIAGNLVNYLKSLLAVTTMIFNPVASDLSARRRKDEIRSLLVNGSRLSLFVSLPVAVSYIASGPEFIGLWISPKYSELSGSILLILATAHIVASPSHAIGSVLYGLSQHRSLAFFRIGEAISNLALSIVLVRQYGLIGVAIGTLVPHIVVTGLMIPIYATRLLGMNPFKYYAEAWTRPLLNAVPFLLLTLYFSKMIPVDGLLMFFVRLAALLAIYLLTGFYVVLNQEERQMIISFIRRQTARLQQPSP